MNDPHAIASAWFLRHRWNFRAAPPEHDLVLYLEAVLVCARGDGGVSPPERDWVVGYGAALGLSERALAALRAYPAADDLSPDFLRGAGVWMSARSLLFDAILACDADNDYTPGEAQAIRRAAAALGVPEADVVALEALHREEKALRARRLELTFSDR